MPTYTEDYNVKPGDLKHVSKAGVVSKKSNGLFGGWKSAYLVISGNCLYIYGSQAVRALLLR